MGFEYFYHSYTRTESIYAIELCGFEHACRSGWKVKMGRTINPEGNNREIGVSISTEKFCRVSIQTEKGQTSRPIDLGENKIIVALSLC